jgi:hypothetical protein
MTAFLPMAMPLFLELFLDGCSRIADLVDGALELLLRNSKMFYPVTDLKSLISIFDRSGWPRFERLSGIASSCSTPSTAFRLAPSILVVIRPIRRAR